MRNNVQIENDEVKLASLLSSAALLVVDDEPGIRNFLKRSLEPKCALLEVAGNAEDAESLRLRYHFDVLLVDIRLPGLSGLEWMASLRERGVRTHVIYMTGFADLDMAVAALRLGADDFIIKPFRVEQILFSIHHALTRGHILRENSLLRMQLLQMRSSGELIGKSIAAKSMIDEAQRLSASKSCLLIQGEVGTGKNLLARTVHKMSRRPGQLVSLRCSSIDDFAKEVDFFGDEGLFVQAHKGSLLVSDVDLLPLASQAVLMSFLEHGAIDPTAVRSTNTKLDVRVIATTQADLQHCVDCGRFRRDLYVHLCALPLRVPALRERSEDLKPLVDLFMQRFAAQHAAEAVELLHTDWQTLAHYKWPGNVRELRDVVERTVLLGRLPKDSLLVNDAKQHWSGPGYPLDQNLETVERAHIEAVLDSVGNNNSAAARILGVSRKTLERKKALWSCEQDDQK